MKLSRILIYSFVAASTALVGCSDSNPNAKVKKPRIAIVTNNPATFWNICEAGARKAEAELNAAGNPIEVIFRKPEKGDVAVQTETIDAVMKQGISGIAISVQNPKEQTSDLKRIGTKVNLLTMDNDAPDCGRKAYIGTDNYKAGRAAGRLVKEVMPGGGTVVIFVGSVSSANGISRRDGVLHELAGLSMTPTEAEIPKGPAYGQYTLYTNAAITDTGNASIAQENATSVMNKLLGEKNLTMVGLYAYNPPAILEAVRSVKKVGEVKIVGFDEDDATLAGIVKGDIHATVVQDPYMFGYQTVKALDALAKDGNAKIADGIVPHRIITKSGAAVKGDNEKRMDVVEFKKELDERKREIK